MKKWIIVIILLLATNSAYAFSLNTFKDFFSDLSELLEYSNTVSKRRKDSLLNLSIRRGESDINNCRKALLIPECFSTSFAYNNSFSYCYKVEILKKDQIDYRESCKESLLAKSLCHDYFSKIHNKDFGVNYKLNKDSVPWNVDCYLFERVRDYSYSDSISYKVADNFIKQTLLINSETCSYVVDNELRDYCKQKIISN